MIPKHSVRASNEKRPLQGATIVPERKSSSQGTVRGRSPTDRQGIIRKDYIAQGRFSDAIDFIAFIAQECGQDATKRKRPLFPAARSLGRKRPRRASRRNATAWDPYIYDFRRRTPTTSQRSHAQDASAGRSSPHHHLRETIGFASVGFDERSEVAPFYAEAWFVRRMR